MTRAAIKFCHTGLAENRPGTVTQLPRELVSHPTVVKRNLLRVFHTLLISRVPTGREFVSSIMNLSPQHNGVILVAFDFGFQPQTELKQLFETSLAGNYPETFFCETGYRALKPGRRCSAKQDRSYISPGN